MTTREANSLLTTWVQQDIDDAQASATAAPPSSQRRLLSELIRQVISGKVGTLGMVKMLGIAQAILAGNYLIFDESDALKRFEQLLGFAMEQHPVEIKDAALTVAALFLNRTRERLPYVSDATIELIRQALRGELSAAQQSVLAAMLQRIEAAVRRLRESRTAASRSFDLPDLDVPNAARNVQDDIQGDWYHDPWAWPEVEWLGRTPGKVLQRLREGLCSWVLSLDVSKRGGGIRPAMVLNPLDRVGYQSLVDELSVEAAGHLPGWVHGWRLTRSEPTKGVYVSNKDDWKRFSRRIADLCNEFRFTAHLDVQSFFPTIDTSRLISQLGRQYRNAAVLDRLEAYFEAWHKCQNGLGVPQRSLASSVLAQCVLRPLDVFLDQKSDGGRSRNFQVTRWMDDIWLHSDNKDDLRSCMLEVEIVLGQSRLSLNAEKSAIFRSEDADEFVQLVDVYEENEDDDPSVTLSELLGRTARSDDAPAFHVGLEVAKILSKKDFRSLAAVSSAGFLQFNYLADRLAKALRVSGDWRRLTDTYLELARTHVSDENWSVAAWAEMFPNNPDTELRSIHDFFCKDLSKNLQRVLVPLAAQRVAAWSSQFSPGKPLDLDWESIFQGQNDVFRLRGICFAALKLDSLKDKVRGVIALIDDEVVESFLKDTNFTSPALSQRFQ